ncbi:MAG: hypothetical protein HY898_26575 [Deltaproteobacteria bacterium]|nr:hypothetical protein [Deltaproteobacteria bacterium]
MEPTKPEKQEGPDRAEVLQFIDKEISSLTEQEKKPGWTTWALSMALLGLVWMIATQPDLLDRDHTTVGIGIAGCSLLIFFLRALTPMEPAPGVNDGKPRFRAASTIVVKAPNLIPFGAWSACLGWILYTCRNEIGSVCPAWLPAWLVWFPGFVCMVLLALLVLSALLLKLIPDHLPLKQKDPPAWLSLVLMALVLPTLLGIVRWLWLALSPDTLSDLRVAGLVSVGAEVALRLASQTSADPALKQFETLRRSVFLRTMSPTEAVDQLEVILLGMSVRHIFQKDIEAFLDAHHQLARATRRARTFFDAQAELLRTADLDSVEEVRASGALATSSIMASVREVRSCVKRMRVCADSFAAKRGVYKSQENDPEWEEIQRRLENTIRRVESDVDRLCASNADYSQQFDEVTKRICERIDALNPDSDATPKAPLPD